MSKNKSLDPKSLFVIFLVVSSLVLSLSSLQVANAKKYDESEQKPEEPVAADADGEPAAGPGKSDDKQGAEKSAEKSWKKESEKKPKKLDAHKKVEESEKKAEAEGVRGEKGPVNHAEILKSRDAKSNKVGFVLSMIHKFSEKSALKKRLDDKEHSKLSEKFHKMQPDKMLKELCPRSFGMCQRWVKRSFKRNSPVIKHIAKTIKERPEGVDPRRLFKFKMYEASAGHIVEKGYDEMADGAINLLAKKNPYLTMPITAIDLSLSVAYGS